MRMNFIITVLVIATPSTALSQTAGKTDYFQIELKAASVAQCQTRLAPETRREMEAKLVEARARYESDPHDAEAVIWLGRRIAYLGRYDEAIAIYTNGIEKHPADARLYRHRGHRYITERRFPEAIMDLERAAKLIAGKPDEVEADGLPNARNIPTSTSHSNIWYHLGLAYYLTGDLKNALRSYRECLKFSRNPDMLAATSHWLYMTLRRLNRGKEAGEVLAPISEKMDIIENRDYHRLLLMYQGKISPDSLLEEAAKNANSLSFASVGYGVANWHHYNGRREQAARIFRQIIASSQCASFGFIAAEAELKKIGGCQVICVNDRSRRSARLPQRRR